jgi:hypothetical protein
VVDADDGGARPVALDHEAAQLPPFEILGGTHLGDIVTPGRRFFQHDYRLRFIGDLFGADGVPPLEISMRGEQGRERRHRSGPRPPMPCRARRRGDLAKAGRHHRHPRPPATPFSAIEGGLSRATRRPWP